MLFYYLQCQRKCESVFNENIRLKQNQSALLEGIKTQEEKYKELEENYIKTQKDAEKRMKEKVETLRLEYEKHKVELDKYIKLLHQDADVSS